MLWATSSLWYWTSESNAYSGSDAVSATVAIQNADGLPGAFKPTVVTVKKGSVIQWTNAPDARVHTVSGDGFDSGAKGLAGGETFKFKFAKAGTFEYHCNFHPVMKATVVVTE